MIRKNKYVQVVAVKMIFVLSGLLALLPLYADARSYIKPPQFMVGDPYVRFFYTDDERSASFDIDCFNLIRDPVIGTYLCTLTTRSYKPILGQFSEDILPIIEKKPEAYLEIQEEYLADADGDVKELKNRIGIDPEVDAVLHNLYQILYAKNKTDLAKAIKTYRELRRGGEICAVQEGKNIFMAEVNQENKINGEFIRRGAKFAASFNEDGLEMTCNSPGCSGNAVGYDAKPGLASKPGCKRVVWW